MYTLLHYCRYVFVVELCNGKSKSREWVHLNWEWFLSLKVEVLYNFISWRLSCQCVCLMHAYYNYIIVCCASYVYVYCVCVCMWVWACVYLTCVCVLDVKMDVCTCSNVAWYNVYYYHHHHHHKWIIYIIIMDELVHLTTNSNSNSLLYCWFTLN